MILLFHAIRREVAPLIARFEDRRAFDESGLCGIRARSPGGSKEIVSIATGMGAARAHEAAERALDRFSNPELIIVAGVAGALIASLRAADIVIADRIIAADGDARAFSPADSQLAVLRRAFESARLPYESGGLLTSRTVLSTADEKRRARESTGAVAVDMETAAIAAAADARGLAVIAIRTILDELNDDLPGPGLVDERGKVDALRVAGYLLRRPGNVLKLPRLARNMSRATRNLADAVELAIRALSAS